MKEFPNRKSIRLKNYDYSQNGLYFVTICTKNRSEIFGQIINGKMQLNPVGKMMNRWWEKIPEKFMGIELDVYQIMPNHFHTIVNIVGAHPCVRPINMTRGLGQTHGSAPTTGTTIGNIIQWFKTMATNEYINRVKTNHWQPFSQRIFQRNYYEHIIRNENELLKIREYILTNPQMWERDRNNIRST